MTDSRFVYVTYINAAPEKVWDALVTPEFMRQYFFGSTFETDWQVGSPWTLEKPGGGGLADSGEVLEVEAPRRLVLSWRSEWMPEAHAEGYGRMVAEIEPSGEAAAKLTITHSIGVADSKLIGAVSGGWPKILSNLKSLLETGSIVGGLVMKAELGKV